MKITIKVALMIALFTSLAFAEGDMGSGGGNSDPGDNEDTCTSQTCPTDDPSDGGETTGGEPDGAILTFIQEFLDSLFG